jgi:hypothetical protein
MTAKNIPEVSGGQMKTIGFLIVVIIVIYAAITIMKRFGLWRTSAERAEAQKKSEQSVATKEAANVMNVSKIFDPVTWSKDSKGRPSIAKLLLSGALAKSYAQKIQKNLGTSWYQYSNETAIYNVFRSLTNQIQVSQIAFAYQALTSHDFAGDLNNGLTNAKLNVINNIIATKPSYSL